MHYGSRSRVRNALSGLVVLAGIAIIASIGGVSGVREAPDTPDTPASTQSEPDVISTAAPEPTKFLEITPKSGSTASSKTTVRVRVSDVDTVAWVSSQIVGRSASVRMTKRGDAYVATIQRSTLAQGRNVILLTATDARGDTTSRRIMLVR